MATNTVTTALILTAYDKMSRVVNDAMNKSIKEVQKFKDQADKASGSFLTLQNFATTVIGSEVLQKPIEAFAELEDSAIRLQTVMTNAGGLAEDKFKKVSNIAVDLGNKLPGATNDFYNMFTEMIQGGMKVEGIINGNGKAAAYLAVQLKLSYEEAGKGVAKLKEATGVADADMLKFMDTIQRTYNVGVKFDEMQYAFSKSAGQLKYLKLQGLEASNEVAALYAMLIKSGASGETVGTGISAAFQAIFDKKKMAEANAEAAKFGIKFKFLDDNENFLGITNFIGQLGRLKNLSQQQIANILTPLFGPTGQDSQFVKTLAQGGVPAFMEMQKRMKDQADLETRVAMQLKSLKNIWDALTGTVTNFLAIIGGSLAPQLKSLATILNNVVGRVGAFLEGHQTLSGIIGWSIGIVAGLAIAAGGLGITLGVLAKVASFSSAGFLFMAKALSWAKFQMWFLTASVKAWSVWGKIAAATQWLFNASLYGCPIVWIIGGIMAVIAAVALLVAYWKPVIAWLSFAWEGLKWKFAQTWETIKGIFNKFLQWLKVWGKWILIPLAPFIAIPILIITNWGKISAFFKALWGDVTRIFNKAVDFIFGLGSRFFQAGQNIISSLWKGVKSIASKPIQAMMDIVSKIRNLLPFSPAKEGPFRDLHKIRIIETIAQTMRPAPMLKAMRLSMDAVANMSGRGGSFRMSGGGGFTYAPVINLSGSAGPRDREDLLKVLNSHKSEVLRWLKSANESANRSNF